MVNKKCIHFIPNNMARIGNVEGIRTWISNKLGYGNIAPPVEELIMFLLQSISQVHIFSYITVHNKTCKVLTPVPEQGTYNTILKWVLDECESMSISPHATLNICESLSVLNHKTDEMPLCGFNSFTCPNGTCLASTCLCAVHYLPYTFYITRWS